MATIKARDVAAPPIPVDVYVDGHLSESYVSVFECARALRVSCETVRLLIATGREMLASDRSITLDIPVNCPYSCVLAKGDDGRLKTRIVLDKSVHEESRA